MAWLVYTTIGSQAEAKELAKRIVSEKLAACCNYFPVSATYEWKDELVEDEEVMLIFKTSQQCYSALEQRIKESHPYELPAIEAVELVDGSPEFLAWIDKQTSQKSI